MAALQEKLDAAEAKASDYASKYTGVTRDRALADADAAFAWDAAAPSGPALTPDVADSTPDAGNSPAPSALRGAAGFPGDWKDVLSSFEDRSEWTEPASAWPPAPDLPEPLGAGAEPSAVPDSPSGERPQVLLLRAMEPPADPAIAEPDTRPAASSAFGSQAAAGQKAQGRTSLEDSAKDAQDLTRLLDQANTEMDEPDNRRRLLTMAHLKAAVAATEADLQSAGHEGQAGDSRRLDRYHADLARAVQQHRPDGPLPSARPAPLPRNASWGGVLTGHSDKKSQASWHWMRPSQTRLTRTMLQR
jgi:hypothetical protein